MVRTASFGSTPRIGFSGFTGDRIAHVTIPSTQIIRRNGGLDIAGVGHVAAMRPNQMPGGFFTIAPVTVTDPAAPAELYLISTHESRGESETGSDTVSVGELRASLHRVVGADLPFTDATVIRNCRKQSPS
jgi:hypothetical protein